jgi:predicted alpha-1,2-mannosidase
MSPAALDSMPGTFIDQVFADAVAKGIVTDKETISLMLEAIMKHANVKGPSVEVGRDGIEEYLSLHYVPTDYREGANKTMNYSYGDFSIATIARHLGMMDVYHEYMKRSQYYRVLFDKETNFIRAKDKQGNMRADFSPFDWGWDYTEGSAWQNTFAVPHDIMGLANLMGGPKALVEKVDQVFNTPPYYRVHWYGTEIHEMTEMAAVDFGQCALSNQPSFHIPYLYSMMGYPNKTAYQVRRAVKELFHWQVGFPGDDDNGSMAGWYVFSMMGFYPVCPTVPQYVLGSPGVKRCVIHTHKGTDFEICAKGNEQETVYWQDPLLNEIPYDKAFLNHEDIMKGGRFSLTMTSTPVEMDYDLGNLPYAVSKDSAEDIFE